MQNKSAVLIFTVLLALATLYTLSFNYFSSEFEKEATKIQPLVKLAELQKTKSSRSIFHS